MPAVQLSILKKQIDDLIWKYTQPELFSRQLHDLLSHYANRVFRGGKNSKNVYKGNKYNSPKFIIDQIIV